MALFGMFIEALMSAAAQAQQEEENAKNRQFAAEEADKDRRENFKYGEMSADAADARARKLYEDYESPEALLKQYRAAGLSPSLMFGGGGVGGQTPTGAQGTGANGITTQYSATAFNPVEAANIGLMAAETAKLNAETDRIKGKGKQGEADVQLKLAQAGHEKAAEALAQADRARITWETYITRETADFSIRKAFSESEKAATDAQKAVYQMISARALADVDDATIKSRIAQEAANVKKTNAETILEHALAGKSNAEKERAKAEVLKWQADIQQRQQEIIIQAFKAQTEKEYNKIMDDYYDELVNNLQNKLDLDNRKFIYTIANDQLKNILTIAKGIVAASGM